MADLSDWYMKVCNRCSRLVAISPSGQTMHPVAIESDTVYSVEGTRPKLFLPHICKKERRSRFVLDRQGNRILSEWYALQLVTQEIALCQQCPKCGAAPDKMCIGGPKPVDRLYGIHADRFRGLQSRIDNVADAMYKSKPIPRVIHSELAYQMSLKRPCPKCDAPAQERCKSLRRGVGYQEDVKWPHAERMSDEDVLAIEALKPLYPVYTKRLTGQGDR